MLYIYPCQQGVLFTPVAFNVSKWKVAGWVTAIRRGRLRR